MSWEDIIKKENELPKPFKDVIKWKGKYYKHYDTKTSDYAPLGIYYIYFPSDKDGNLVGNSLTHEIKELALDSDSVDAKIIEGDFGYVGV